jgi:hypothetical protein
MLAAAKGVSGVNAKASEAVNDAYGAAEALQAGDSRQVWHQAQVKCVAASRPNFSCMTAFQFPPAAPADC